MPLPGCEPIHRCPLCDRVRIHALGPKPGEEIQASRQQPVVGVVDSGSGHDCILLDSLITFDGVTLVL